MYLELVIGWEQTNYAVDDSRDGPDAVICATIMSGTLETSIADIVVDIIPGINVFPGKTGHAGRTDNMFVTVCDGCHYQTHMSQITQI